MKPIKNCFLKILFVEAFSNYVFIIKRFLLFSLVILSSCGCHLRWLRSPPFCGGGSGCYQHSQGEVRNKHREGPYHVDKGAAKLSRLLSAKLYKQEQLIYECFCQGLNTPTEGNTSLLSIISTHTRHGPRGKLKPALFQHLWDVTSAK